MGWPTVHRVWFLNVLIHSDMVRFDAEYGSEVFEVPDRCENFLVILSSRLTDSISFLSRPSISCLWLFVVGRS